MISLSISEISVAVSSAIMLGMLSFDLKFDISQKSSVALERAISYYKGLHTTKNLHKFDALLLMVVGLSGLVVDLSTKRTLIDIARTITFLIGCGIEVGSAIPAEIKLITTSSSASSKSEKQKLRLLNVIGRGHCMIAMCFIITILLTFYQAHNNTNATTHIE